MSLAQTELFFGDQSPLHGAQKYGGPAYETRPQQFEMARAVANVLDNGAMLCVEAPTGVGKTFAYLVPALYHAIENERPVVISTHTINLQEQITQRDVPLLSKLLNRDIDCKIAKGRSNYLCKYRVAQLRMGASYLPSMWESRLLKWADRTESGDRSEFKSGGNRPEWAEVSCSRDNCVGKKCPFQNKCFLTLARRALSDAQIIIANHAYLLSALKMGEDSGLLPACSAYIIDEGHTLPGVATDQLGCHANTLFLKRMLRRIIRDGGQQGGLFAGPGGSRIISSASLLLTRLDSYLPKLTSFIKENAPEASSVILRSTEPQPDRNPFAEPLAELDTELQHFKQQLDEKSKSQTGAVNEIAAALKEFVEEVQTFYDNAQDDWAYWYELTGSSLGDVIFNSVPVNPAPQLNELLFNGNLPVVVTSATLAINRDMHYFKEQLGAWGSQELLLSSPFNCEEQVTLYTPPMPEPDTPGYQPALNAAIKKYLDITEGRAFVLFTSHAQLQRSAKALARFFEERGYTLFAQGGKLAPRQILERFRKTPRAVVFGTDSFWTGVDVPGAALSNVIITRLPFAQIGHPIAQCRDELCRAQGRSSFSDFTLPEAVLKFRQGFGRLIRTQTDQGIIVLLDGRLFKKHYGKIFLNSIPTCKSGLD